MEANGCCSNDDHGDIEARLPPRKRLLAGLKRQSSQTAFPSSPHSPYFGKTQEEVIEDSLSAAKAAAEVAAAAKAAALEKAAAAARAFAAAKRALELVASLDEDVNAGGNSARKPKKQVPIKVLYKGRRRFKNDNDEELARRLHRAINSSPRISSNFASSNREKQGKRKKAPSELPKHKRVLICEGTPSSVRDVESRDGDRAVLLSSSDRELLEIWKSLKGNRIPVVHQSHGGINHQEVPFLLLRNVPAQPVGKWRQLHLGAARISGRLSASLRVKCWTLLPRRLHQCSISSKGERNSSEGGG
ncbi:hypothetical protein H6P81_018796 [Aristolochia fimbriata]|uniref:Uncharacterized protein n=1 Tax=Aristolochia fimbriata TaxID=158543 RepID=A0AAV7E2A1_ARIFI|nr:hypothetical protein H6P81_018796 [Aristolochia fimbriata]